MTKTKMDLTILGNFTGKVKTEAGQLSRFERRNRCSELLGGKSAAGEPTGDIAQLAGNLSANGVWIWRGHLKENRDGA
ncbi:MAG: hypothetical protein JWL90_1708 [Chthoniobacteraceae bacterium]|nr:hypothetical protein [Chthoniobacteraceae bacterium]